MQNNEDLKLLYGIKPPGKNITVKKKILSETINLILIVGLYFTIFLSVGKSIVIPNIAKESIEEINEIYQKISDEKGLETKVYKSNYNFIEIDQDKFIEKYLQENQDKTIEDALDKYFDARAEIFSDVRKNAGFQKYNGHFTIVYFSFYIVTIFVLLFIFEFLIPLFSKKSMTLGMKLTNLSIVNINDNFYPNKLKLLPRFFTILLIEHILLRYFFGNIYFIVLILLNLIVIFVTPNNLFLHDIASMTKVINQTYVGYLED